MSLARLFGACLFGHDRTNWTRVIVGGVWMKACGRCQTPYAALLAHRGEREDITASTVPPIRPRHAQKAKQVKPSKSLRWPRKVS